MILCSRRQNIILFLAFAALTTLLHLRSFSVNHNEGDEIVFRALASEMHWDLSHYTTQDHPRVNKFPSPIYRKSLFIHPPFYPLILKIGYAVGNANAIGLLFQLFSMFVFLAFALRFATIAGLSPPITALLLSFFSLCPVHLYSTTKLHLDGLFSIYLFSGFVATWDALEHQSDHKMPWLKLLIAILLLLIAFNLRFTAIIALPLLALIQFFYLWYSGTLDTPNAWRSLRHWRGFIIICSIIMIGGLSHQLRFYLTYKTLLPWQFLGGKKEAYGWNNFTRSIYDRTHLHMLAYLVATIPMLGVVVTTPFIRLFKSLFVARAPMWLFFAAFGYLFIVLFSFQHNQMRYQAPYLPFFYCIIAWMFQRSERPFAFGIIICLSLYLMVTTGFVNSAVKPGNAKVIPGIIYQIPLLSKFYL